MLHNKVTRSLYFFISESGNDTLKLTYLQKKPHYLFYVTTNLSILNKAMLSKPLQRNKQPANKRLILNPHETQTHPGPG